MGWSRSSSRPRERSRSRDRFRDYDRSPPRRGGYNRSPRRDWSPPQRGHGGDRISLLVRNIGERANAEDLRRLFEKYGSIKDVYIPLDYYTRSIELQFSEMENQLKGVLCGRRPKNFAFVEFFQYDEAQDAVERLHRREFDGRQLDIVFAQQSRKTPDQMRAREQPYGRSPPRARSPQRDRSYSRGRSPRARSSRRSPSPRRSLSPRASEERRRNERDDLESRTDTPTRATLWEGTKA